MGCVRSVEGMHRGPLEHEIGRILRTRMWALHRSAEVQKTMPVTTWGTGLDLQVRDHKFGKMGLGLPVQRKWNGEICG